VSLVTDKLAITLPLVGEQTDSHEYDTLIMDAAHK
jgi:hypothetical protein